MDSGQPLAGLKVIELAGVLAGPAVGMFLAELGAEVIKIENPATGGDVTRSWKLPSENPGSNISAYFSSVNWGKQYRFTNLKTAEGQAEIHALAKEADIVLVNFKPGDDAKLRMDYETLKAINPKIIYAELTGFGKNDERTAFDVIIQAEAGYMYMNGTPESGPVKMPVALMDLLAAHQMKEGILLALLKREKTGKGSLVSVSLYESAIATLANQATNWLMASHIPQRMGSGHPNICPYGDILTCAGGKQVVLAVGTERQFVQLCELLGNPALAKDERFGTNYARVANREELVKELNLLAQKHNGHELLQTLHSAKIPAGAVLNMQQVFENPTAKQMILDEEINGVKTRRVKTVGFRLKD